MIRLPQTLKMQTYSRKFLQQIPTERKKQRIDGIITSFISDLQTQAASGKTTYMYNTQLLDDYNVNRLRKRPGEFPPDPEILLDELLAGIRERFPDCDVNYEETWVDKSNNIKVLKRGIVIDWS